MGWKFSKKDLDRFQKALGKGAGAGMSESDAREAAGFLLDLFEICGRHRNRERKWRERLGEEPDGFPLPPGVVPCVICRNAKDGTAMWFDKWGPKCDPCQLMMRRHALPSSACTNRSSWLDEDEVREMLGIGSRKLEAMVAGGDLIARTVKGTGFRLFLRNENRLLRSAVGDKKSLL